MKATTPRLSLTPRQALLFGTPLALGILAFTLPGVSGPPGVFAQLQSHASYWLALHLLMLPLLGLLALAGVQLLSGSTRRAALVSRWAFGAFAIFAVAYDAALGVGTGVLLRFGLAQGTAGRLAATTATEALWHSRALLLLGVLAALAWWLALTAALLAFTRPAVSYQLLLMVCVLSAALFANGQIEGANTFLWWAGMVVVVALFAYTAEPRALAALFAGSALLFSAGFAAPYGPLGMLCFIGAVALIEMPIGMLRPVSSRSRPAATGSRSSRHAR
jgi:hypothetical protein